MLHYLNRVNNSIQLREPPVNEGAIHHIYEVDKIPELVQSSSSKEPMQSEPTNNTVNHSAKNTCAYTNCYDEVYDHLSLRFLSKPICFNHYLEEYKQFSRIPAAARQPPTRKCAYENCLNPSNFSHPRYSRLIIGGNNPICPHHYYQEAQLLGNFTKTPRGSLPEEQRLKYLEQIKRIRRRYYGGPHLRNCIYPKCYRGGAKLISRKFPGEKICVYHYRQECKELGKVHEIKNN